MHRGILLLTAFLTLGACAGSKGEPAGNQDAPEPAVAEEPVAAAPVAEPAPPANPDGKDEHEAMTGPTPVGDWVSTSCGERTYERRISFFGEPSDRRTFEGQDRVSPCPEGAQCIWSGIVAFNGRWWSTDTGVGLDELRSAPPGQGHERPKSLTWQDGKLVEGDDCLYTVAEAP